MMPMVRQAPLLAVLAIALCGTAAAQPVAASAPATPAFLAGVETAAGCTLERGDQGGHRGRTAEPSAR